MSRNKKVILFGSSSPIDKAILQSMAEYEYICYQQYSYDISDLYKLIPFFRLSVEKFIDKTSDINPNILHFSLHGSLEGDIIFENEKTKLAQKVDSLYFGRFFKFDSQKLELVFLNSCYSIEQAVEVSKHIKNVIALSHEIEDSLAIKFAINFYTRLFKKNEYLHSFAFAQNSINMLGNTKNPKPIFYKNGKMVKEEKIKKIYSKSDISESEINEANVQAQQILTEIKEMNEARGILQNQSPHKNALDILLKIKREVSRQAAKKVLGFSKEWKIELLASDISDILEFVYNAILLKDNSDLICFEPKSNQERSIIIECLHEISNSLLTNTLIEKADSKLIVEYIDILVEQINID